MITNRLRVKLSLMLTYFVFAILLNSVGTVILQVINSYAVSKEAASVLEGFKDLPIAIVSFALAAYLPRFGYRRAMMTGSLMISAVCLLMPLFPGFLMTKMLFLVVGSAFGLVKVSLYSTVGLITDDKQQHASVMNTIEGIFMVGVLSGYWLFSAFIDGDNPTSTDWLNVYWWLALLGLANFLLLLLTPFKNPMPEKEQGNIQAFMDMLRLVFRPLVLVFILSAFLYVLIEQGIGTWLPTFNNEVLHLPADMSVQATSIFAACLAIGRLGAGVLMQRLNWYLLLNICLLSMAALVLVSMPLANLAQENAQMSWSSAPLAAFIFPLIGLFMAPIYPAINSIMLSSLPKVQHSAMTGLIVIFSALGGTTGSIITGLVFGSFNGQTAFYFSLVPIAAISVTLFFFRRATLTASSA
ncbi:MFS transporter [Aliiglaciecola sp. CAU 1673]|uniref:MFS transporter n=1 Tax=Aliiglaciecola sp. CAU 1673 TaxID=3032595 RepID=UPI0023DB182B|nr:MFS transporter [Aliiglaciecola sp. CAU 1673]MDF2178492.1 MFS transporter [Aliiglaciecola sp. CAU 1673]